MVILGISLLVWAGLLAAFRRHLSPSHSGPALIDRSIIVLAVPQLFVGLVAFFFLVLPSVALVIDGVIDASYGWSELPAAIGLFLIGPLPMVAAALIFRRSVRRGKQSRQAVAHAVFGGSAIGVVLLLWLLVALASTGM